MTTFHSWNDGFVSFTKGAIDVLIDKSANILTNAGLETFDSAEILRVNERMAADGLRVLCIAMRKWETLPEDTSLRMWRWASLFSVLSA
jgi:Ca2+-transporting ATPase